jgi:hypothetical protein
VSKIPVLIIAFNRPDNLLKLINSLRKTKYRTIRISIDGPRNTIAQDRDLIKQNIEIVKSINWTDDIEIYQNETNLKPRFAVPRAVNRVLEDFNKLIVLEDDVEVTPEAIQFFTWHLKQLEKSNSIGHISAYNNIPNQIINCAKETQRLSIFPESYAWATWRDKWLNYEDEIENVDIMKTFSRNQEYFENIGLFGKLSWCLEKRNAQNNYISTWAYRWMFALWKHNLYCVTSNYNLIKYNGHKNGSNTNTNPRWIELETHQSSKLEFIPNYKINPEAEKWASRKVQRDNVTDFIKLILISFFFKFNILKYRRGK